MVYLKTFGFMLFLHGFDNSEILASRPYGGCAILYQSISIFNVSPLNVGSRRVCAAHVDFESTKLL
jgi:hypothetical protein